MTHLEKAFYCLVFGLYSNFNALVFEIVQEKVTRQVHNLDCIVIKQGIINMNRNGNSANVFSYVCNGKKIKELFASTLNGIPASVKCVSFMIVVLSAKFARLLAAHVNKKMVRNEKASSSTLKFNFYRSYDCARKNESIIYFPTIYAS